MAAARNSFVKASSAKRSASRCAARSASSSASFFSKAAWMAISHSGLSISPEPSASISVKAARNRLGTNMSCRNLFPQLTMNRMTSWFSVVASTNSWVARLLELSTSISSKTWRAAAMNSAMNLSSSARDRAARRFWSALRRPSCTRNAASTASSHSCVEISPSESVSKSARAFSRRFGCNNCLKIRLPEFWRKSTISLSFSTASTISSFVIVPE